MQAEADTARACLRLNEKIATKSDLSYGAFVRSEPALDGIRALSVLAVIACLVAVAVGV